jgi:hypothetical protein
MISKELAIILIFGGVGVGLAIHLILMAISYVIDKYINSHEGKGGLLS